MNAKDIIALANAGFNAAQIAKIAQSEESAPAQQAATTQAAPSQEAAAQAAHTQAQKAETSPAQPEYADLLGKMDALVAQIQQSAILNSAQPKEESADDILAAIIDPPQFHPNNNK